MFEMKAAYTEVRHDSESISCGYAYNTKADERKAFKRFLLELKKIRPTARGEAMKDEAEEKAEKIFDTSIDEEDLKQLMAAALREAQGDARNWKLQWADSHREVNKLSAEIAKLKAEIERLKKLDEIGSKAHNANLLEMADMRAVICRLTAERDAAIGKPYQNIIQKEMLRDEFVRGLERAIEIIRLCRTTEHYALLEESGVLDVSNAIQAEIDKAKGG